MYQCMSGINLVFWIKSNDMHAMQYVMPIDGDLLNAQRHQLNGKEKRKKNICTKSRTTGIKQFNLKRTGQNEERKNQKRFVNIAFQFGRK